MTYRSLALAVAAFSSLHVASADAQSIYVAPGGVYVGGGPVYVIPAPNNGAGPYVAPSYGYEYAPPAVAAPPAVVAPTTVYESDGGYYAPPTVVAPAPLVAPTTVYRPNGGYYGAPLSAYAAELPPRPRVAVPYSGSRRCGTRYGYSPCY
jgi:hypothetical protein